MAKERLFDLPETKGSFQICGKVTGTEKEGFYKEIKTKVGNKDMRMVNFGVEYDEKKTQYVGLNGMTRDSVYFSKKAEKKGDKPDVQKVNWAERFTYNRDGYRMMGTHLGVKKTINDKGETVNDKKVFTEFDACKEIKENLKDGNSVFIRGSLDYSSYANNNGDIKHSIKMIPNQISLCKDVDFSDDKFAPQSDFHQDIVFMDITKEVNEGKETGRFVLSAKIVNYSSIEDAEFIITDSKLATLFKKNLKPYYALRVNGHMESITPTETVEDEDSWGESDAMEKVSTPTKREFIITGAKPSTIDKEAYSQDKVEAAIEKINRSKNAEKNFGGDESWGDTANLDKKNEEDDEW